MSEKDKPTLEEVQAMLDAMRPQIENMDKVTGGKFGIGLSLKKLDAAILLDDKHRGMIYLKEIMRGFRNALMEQVRVVDELLAQDE